MGTLGKIILTVIIILSLGYFFEKSINFLNFASEEHEKTAIDLSQYLKYEAYETYIECYEIYAYPKFGIYAFYAKEGNTNSEKFETLRCLDYRKTLGEFKNKHIYVFDYIPDLTEIKSLENPSPFAILSRLKKLKPAMWSLYDDTMHYWQDNTFICDKNTQGSYDLYTGNDFFKLKFNSGETEKYCKTDY